MNATLLRRNLAANSITNVTVMQIALSDRDGELAFHEAAFGAGSHVVTADHLGENWTNVAVPMMTLDQVVRQQGGTVSFAKIDAEGHEPNILAGARQVIERDAPVLYMEFNSWCLNAFGGHSPAAFAKALWRAFTVSRADPAGALSDVAGGPIGFLHGNLTQHGCVDDLVLHIRRGVEFPSLVEMSWPSEARERTSGDSWSGDAARARAEAAAKQRMAVLEMEFVRREAEDKVLRAWIDSYQASTSWRVTRPLRAAGRLLKTLRARR